MAATAYMQDDQTHQHAHGIPSEPLPFHQAGNSALNDMLDWPDPFSGVEGQVDFSLNNPNAALGGSTEGDYFPSISEPVTTNARDDGISFNRLGSLISSPMSSLPAFHRNVQDIGSSQFLGEDSLITGSLPDMYSQDSDPKLLPRAPEIIETAGQKRKYQESQNTVGRNISLKAPAQGVEPLAKTSLSKELNSTTITVSHLWIAKHPGRKPTYHQSSCLSYIFNDSPYGLQDFFNRQANLHAIDCSQVPPSLVSQKTPDFITMTACIQWQHQNGAIIPDDFIVACMSHAFDCPKHLLNDWFIRNCSSTRSPSLESGNNPDAKARPLVATYFRHHSRFCLQKSDSDSPPINLSRDPTRPIMCTCRCGERFSVKEKTDWIRHEIRNRRKDLFFCGLQDCKYKAPHRRVCLRRDNYRSHLRGIHNITLSNAEMDAQKLKLGDCFEERCIFHNCRQWCSSWNLWLEHISKHFEDPWEPSEWQDSSSMYRSRREGNSYFEARGDEFDGSGNGNGNNSGNHSASGNGSGSGNGTSNNDADTQQQGGNDAGSSSNPSENNRERNFAFENNGSKYNQMIILSGEASAALTQ
ncbi:uncharacterized protein KY384_005104 [Bacidia gigantensis]|uniref:uncharacterized protein n=1 Tax=Bacidia gigantensis TaxID=2732470 RepID=UPI001D0522BA|nr:uncharacterized protein KY384_005104 [Bacidia gigantensis]KAG8529624.1 hypothetical protein KY384_005104 [Bacidia gigantensis]